MDNWIFYNQDTVSRIVTIKANNVPWPLHDAELRFAVKKNMNDSNYIIGPKLLTIIEPDLGKAQLDLTSDETDLLGVYSAEIEMYMTASQRRKTIWQGSVTFNQTIIKN